MLDSFDTMLQCEDLGTLLDFIDFNVQVASLRNAYTEGDI